MKKVVGIIIALTNVSLFAPVFELENQAPNSVTVKIYAGILDIVQITNAESLAQIVIDGSEGSRSMRATLVVLDQEGVNNYTVTGTYTNPNNAPITQPNPLPVRNAGQTEQILLRQGSHGIRRITYNRPAARAKPVVYQTVTHPKEYNDQDLENEFDIVRERIQNELTINPDDVNLLEALKAERTRRAELEKKMMALSEKYYTVGLTPEEKQEVRTFPVNLMAGRISLQFYKDVKNGTNEFARATQDFILTKAPLQNLTDLQLVKAQIHYRTVREEARKNRSMQDPDPEGRAYLISQEMLRRIKEDPSKNKEFDEIELKLLGLKPTITPEQNKQLLLSLQQLLTNVKKTILLKESLEKEILQLIKNKGFDAYYKEHLQEGSKSREAFNQEFEKFLNVVLVGDEKEWVDAQKIVVELARLIDFEYYDREVESTKLNIDGQIDNMLACIDDSIHERPCVIKHATKKIIKNYKGVFMEFIDDISADSNEDVVISSSYGVQFLTLLLAAINEEFSKILNPKEVDEPTKKIVKEGK